MAPGAALLVATRRKRVLFAALGSPHYCSAMARELSRLRSDRDDETALEIIGKLTQTRRCHSVELHKQRR